MFGTAVHAVLRRGRGDAGRRGRAALRRRGLDGRHRRRWCTPSLEDVFLDVVERRRRSHEEGAAPSARKELRQIVRDRRTLLILLFVPAFFLLLYGYALNFDIRHIALAVQDRDGSTASRAARLRLHQLGLLRATSATDPTRAASSSG